MPETSRHHESGEGIQLAGEGDGNDWFAYFTSHPRRFENTTKLFKKHAAYITTLMDVLPEKATLIELGCGPATRLLTILGVYPRRAMLLDRDSRILGIAKRNAQHLSLASVDFTLGDINNPDLYSQVPRFDVASHHGVAEHYDEAQVRRSLGLQLKCAQYVVFVVPIRTSFNEAIFRNDGIRRFLWSRQYWENHILRGFVIDSLSETHSDKDELVVRLRSLGGENGPVDSSMEAPLL